MINGSSSLSEKIVNGFIDNEVLKFFSDNRPSEMSEIRKRYLSGAERDIAYLKTNVFSCYLNDEVHTLCFYRDCLLLESGTVETWRDYDGNELY